MGDKIHLIDSGEETAREISTILYLKGLLSEDGVPEHRFLTTGSEQVLKLIVRDWLCVEPVLESIII
jgi:glutamate racemase